MSEYTVTVKRIFEFNLEADGSKMSHGEIEEKARDVWEAMMSAGLEGNHFEETEIDVERAKE